VVGIYVRAEWKLRIHYNKLNEKISKSFAIALLQLYDQIPQSFQSVIMKKKTNHIKLGRVISTGLLIL